MAVMHSRIRTWSVLIAVVAVLAAPILGFSHALVPHTHTHTHDNALHTVIEHGLESSLSRKEFGVAALGSWVVLFALIPILVVNRIPPFVYATPPHLRMLRRGIVPYRTFR